MEKIKSYTILISIIIIVLLLLLNKCNKESLIEMENVHSAVIEELEIKYNKDKSQTAKRQVIVTNNTKDFLKLQFEVNSTLKELQDLVKENKKSLKKGGSATIYEGETKIDKSTTTNIIYDDTNVVYYSHFRDDWIEYSIKASFDTTLANIYLKNKYSIVFGTESQGLFKDRKPYVNITNHNPHSSTKELRSYEVKGYKQKRFGLGFNVSYGVNYKPNIVTSNKITTGIYVGFGINYNLIQL